MTTFGPSSEVAPSPQAGATSQRSAEERSKKSEEREDIGEEYTRPHSSLLFP
jgi:hypothetical protein